MPIEIRQVTIKAEVENKQEDAKITVKENLDIKNIDVEYLLDEIFRKTKKNKER